MAAPLIQSAGIAKENEDANHTGKDDLIGFALVSLSELITAILSDDTNKIQAALNKTTADIPKLK